MTRRTFVPRAAQRVGGNLTEIRSASEGSSFQNKRSVELGGSVAVVRAACRRNFHAKDCRTFLDVAVAKRCESGRGIERLVLGGAISKSFELAGLGDHLRVAAPRRRSVENRESRLCRHATEWLVEQSSNVDLHENQGASDKGTQRLQRRHVLGQQRERLSQHERRYHVGAVLFTARRRIEAQLPVTELAPLNLAFLSTVHAGDDELLRWTRQVFYVEFSRY